MSNNILEPVVNSLSETFKVGLKWFYKLMNIKPYFDIENFFKQIEFKNKKGQYPKLIKVYESPKGYTYLVSCPYGLGLDDFLKLKGALEIQLRNNIQIRDRKGYIEIEVLSKELPSKIDFKLPIRTKKTICIPIGEGIEGMLYIDLKENPHSYIVGQTGSGKSVATKVILTSLINMYSSNEIELYLADLKRVELNLFANTSHCKKFVYTVSDTTELIADLLEETNRRYDLFMKNKVTSIAEYNQLKGVKKLKYQVLYIEEMILLLEDKKKNAMKLLKQLMAISRASGLYVICTTQRPSSDIIDNVVKSLISNRIVFKVEDRKNSIICLDSEGAEKLEGQGHGILKVGATKTEFRGYYITDNQVKEYTKKYIVNRSYEPMKATQRGFKRDNDIIINKENKELKRVKCETIKESEKIVDLSFIDNL